MNNYSQNTDKWILCEIEYYQGIQKNNHSSTPEWERASIQLQPLFDEMKNRQQQEIEQ